MQLTYYNLRADPFRLSPDPRFCFPHRTYRKAMIYMRHALQRAEGFIIITGQPGMGKTTLINDLFRELRPDQLRVARLVSTQLLADDLLRLVAYELNLAPEGLDKASLLNRVGNFLRQQHREGRRTLLLVDEAQDVSGEALEELRLLTNIQVDGQQLLQIFLVGQEELRDAVSDQALVQLHQRIIATAHLEPLDATETREYIRHRLRRVGWEGNPLISHQAYAVIHRFSHGIPRQINQICSRLLLHGSLEEQDRLGVQDMRIVIEELHGEMLLPPGMQEIADSMIWPANSAPETYDERPRSRPESPVEAAELNPGTTMPPEDTTGPSVATEPVENTIGEMTTDLPPELEAATSQNSALADNARAGTTDRPAPVVMPTPSRQRERRRNPLRFLALVVLLAGLLLALLFALDSETRHRLRDTLAALIPSDVPARQAPQTALAPGQPITTDSVPRDTVAVTPDTAADDTATIRPGDTTEVAVKNAPPAVSMQITAVETGQVSSSLLLSGIETELVENGLQASYTDDGSLKVNLTGDGVFEFNSTQVSDSASGTLAQLAGVLASHDAVSVHVVGHTDSSGHPEYNLQLSRRRAQAVVDYLVEKGLPEDRTGSEGRGDLDTRLEESTRDQPELRRRVEIYIRPFRLE